MMDLDARMAGLRELLAKFVRSDKGALSFLNEQNQSVIRCIRYLSEFLL